MRPISGVVLVTTLSETKTSESGDQVKTKLRSAQEAIKINFKSMTRRNRESIFSFDLVLFC